MLAAQHPDRKGHILSDDELIAEMVLFLLAGYDTSSNVLSLLCYYLAVYPEIQEKLVAEIKQVCEFPDTTNYEEIRNMPYLEACISETLRLYPPGKFPYFFISLFLCFMHFRLKLKFGTEHNRCHFNMLVKLYPKKEAKRFQVHTFLFLAQLFTWL